MNYTTRQDAIELLERITTAPDIATKMNLIDELQERYLSLATNTQMLAESNERWAKESRQKSEAVEAIIEGLLNLYPDEENQPDAIKDLAELFDISLAEERTYVVTISATVKVMVPRWNDEEQSAWDFTSSGLKIEHDEFDSELGDYSIDSVEEA
jgi:hypothetical protein